MNSHPKSAGVKEQFLAAWRHSGLAKPTVQRIYQIRNPPQVFAAYEQYRGDFGGAEARYFHGTSQICDFGSNLSKPPCESSACAVCNICRAGFDIQRARTEESGGTPNFALRYGEGSYFAPDSSKSHSYNQGSHRDTTHGKYRVMFLCKVAKGGNPHETTASNISHRDVEMLIRGGHTAIIGRTSPEPDGLNFEEVVVYQNAAAIPSYLIVYKM